MGVEQRIAAALTEAFRPTTLRIIDESHLHAGHSGARPGGETHFRVQVVSDAFTGVGRLERHRMVNAVLADELRDWVHALAIQARAPADAELPFPGPTR